MRHANQRSDNDQGQRGALESRVAYRACREKIPALDERQMETLYCLAPHPWDLETPQERAERIIRHADELEWALRRQSAEFPRIEGDEDTVPGRLVPSRSLRQSNG